MATPDEDAARRTTIQFCVQSGMTPINTFRHMQSTERYKSVSRSLVFKWHKKFSDGDVEMVARGRPPYKDDKTVKRVQNVIDGDRRHTVREVAEVAGVSKSTVQRILTSDLMMSHVSARWVPRLLTTEEKQVRVDRSRKFLRKVKRDKSYLSRIITTDETWVHYFEPESKQSSMVWKHSDSPPPKKAKAVRSVGKVMCIVFLDMKGVVLVHMVRSGHTVDSDYYSKTLRRDFMHALRKKRPYLADQLENVVLHQDNAPSHNADDTQLDIDVLGLQRSEHPPYSPDLAPLDFAYFPKLKAYLRGTKFNDRNEIKQAIQQFNRSLDSDWFQDVYQQWVRRHHKCIEHNGEYFEKE